MRLRVLHFSFRVLHDQLRTGVPSCFLPSFSYSYDIPYASSPFRIFTQSISAIRTAPAHQDLFDAQCANGSQDLVNVTQEDEERDRGGWFRENAKERNINGMSYDGSFSRPTSCFSSTVAISLAPSKIQSRYSDRFFPLTTMLLGPPHAR